MIWFLRLTSVIRGKFELLTFPRWCSDTFKVWWDLQLSLCCKFTAEYVSEKILKIGKEMTELQPWVWCLPFLEHGVNCYSVKLRQNIDAIYLTDNYNYRRNEVLWRTVLGHTKCATTVSQIRAANMWCVRDTYASASLCVRVYTLCLSSSRVISRDFSSSSSSLAVWRRPIDDRPACDRPVDQFGGPTRPGSMLQRRHGARLPVSGHATLMDNADRTVRRQCNQEQPLLLPADTRV